MTSPIKPESVMSNYEKILTEYYGWEITEEDRAISAEYETASPTRKAEIIEEYMSDRPMSISGPEEIEAAAKAIFDVPPYTVAKQALHAAEASLRERGMIYYDEKHLVRVNDDMPIEAPVAIIRINKP
jgi:hypothetical protein